MHAHGYVRLPVLGTESSGPGGCRRLRILAPTGGSGGNRLPLPAHRMHAEHTQALTWADQMQP